MRKHWGQQEGGDGRGRSLLDIWSWIWVRIPDSFLSDFRLFLSSLFYHQEQIRKSAEFPKVLANAHAYSVALPRAQRAGPAWPRVIPRAGQWRVSWGQKPGSTQISQSPSLRIVCKFTIASWFFFLFFSCSFSISSDALKSPWSHIRNHGDAGRGQHHRITDSSARPR